MKQVATWIADLVDTMSAGGDVEAAVTRVRGEVAALCSRFPVYGARPG